MTWNKRSDIFAKDVLTIEDIQELLCMSYQDAAKFIRDAKQALKMNPKYNNQGVRLDIQGRLHVQDYFDYFNITNMNRYVGTQLEEGEEK